MENDKIMQVYNWVQNILINENELLGFDESKDDDPVKVTVKDMKKLIRILFPDDHKTEVIQ